MFFAVRDIASRYQFPVRYLRLHSMSVVAIEQLIVLSNLSNLAAVLSFSCPFQHDD